MPGAPGRRAPGRAHLPARHLLLAATLCALPSAACAEAVMAVRPFPHARQRCAPAASEGFAVPQSPALSPTATRLMLWGRSGDPVPSARREPVCQQVGCRKRATFGRACDGSVGRSFCAEHRSAASHVDLNRKRCKHAEGCEAYAYYQGWAAMAAAEDAPCPYAPSPAAPVAGGRFPFPAAHRLTLLRRLVPANISMSLPDNVRVRA